MTREEVNSRLKNAGVGSSLITSLWQQVEARGYAFSTSGFNRVEITQVALGEYDLSGVK